MNDERLAVGHIPVSDLIAHESAAGRGVLHFQCASEVALSLGVIGFQAEGFMKSADGFVDLTLQAEGDTKVVVSVGIIGLQAEGFPELADRLVGLAFIEKNGAEIVVGLDVIGFQADGFLKKDQLAAEALANARADKLLAQEEVWVRKGVEARRTRSVGRVARLEALRATRAARRETLGRVRQIG